MAPAMGTPTEERCHCTSASGMSHDPRRTGSVVYIYVSDADAVHAEWTASGVDGRFGEVRDTDYGLREFGYVDPDGTLHRVGSPRKP